MFINRSAKAKGDLVPRQPAVRRLLRARGPQPDHQQGEAALRGAATPGETTGLPGVQHRPAPGLAQESATGRQL